MELNLAAFKEAIAPFVFFRAGQRVVIGYSGGADSTALVHLFHRAGLDCVAAHLHHGMRPEADKELELCAAFCDSISVPFVSGRADVPAIAKELKIGLEEAGREARYNFLGQAAATLGCEWIATAHTRTDQAETVLLNVLRGTGLRGIGGIHAERQTKVRPLLSFSREATRAYCEAKGLWFHDDPSNEDPAMTRSRLRSAVMPLLRSFNPALESTLAHLSETAQVEDAFLDGMAAAALERSELRPMGELSFLTADAEIDFDQASLQHLPPVLLRRAIRLGFEALGQTLDYRQTVQAEWGLAPGGQDCAKGSVTAEGGRVVGEWDGEIFTIRRLDPAQPFRENLTLPGETIDDVGGWSLVAFTEPFSGQSTRRGTLEVALDARSLRAPIHARSWEAGDRVAPVGFDGQRKLADLMSEAKLTELARRRLPIVCDMLGPIWVPGIAPDSRAAITENTELVLVLRFGPATEAQSGSN